MSILPEFLTANSQIVSRDLLDWLNAEVPNQLINSN